MEDKKPLEITDSYFPAWKFYFDKRGYHRMSCAEFREAARSGVFFQGTVLRTFFGRDKWEPDGFTVNFYWENKRFESGIIIAVDHEDLLEKMRSRIRYYGLSPLQLEHFYASIESSLMKIPKAFRRRQLFSFPRKAD